ncbi:hypothetical protein EI94DRAFT_1009569 [Lactarius quietus]|nr:hypothetical protein EI94DRAFT_1009569 [Lactarius quietus]
MLFHESFTLLIASIASASSVTALIVRNTPTCPMQGPMAGSLTCCANTVSYGSLTGDQKNALSQKDSNLNTIHPVGTGCFTPQQPGSFDACDLETPGVADVYCCDAIQTQAPINGYAANCVSPSGSS